MKFSKGHKKVGGRAKGTGNKRTQAVKEIVEGVLGKSIPERLLELSKLYPREEIGILTDLMPYTSPKLQSTEVQMDVGADVDESIKELAEWLRNVKEDK